MSDREEKLIDLLKDLSNKCDTLKSSKKLSFPLELVCTNCNYAMELTEHMKTKDFIVCEKYREEIQIPKKGK